MRAKLTLRIMMTMALGHITLTARNSCVRWCTLFSPQVRLADENALLDTVCTSCLNKGCRSICGGGNTSALCVKRHKHRTKFRIFLNDWAARLFLADEPKIKSDSAVTLTSLIIF